MNTVISGIEISSVNMEDRKNLGLKSGDTVRVHQKIEDKGKTRIQVFEGLVLARKHGSEAGATFTVRKVVDGIGVEKVFPLYSPLIDKIEITKRSTVRRAKLYYIREKVAREIRRQMRRMHLMNVASESEIEIKAKREKKAADEAAAQERKEAREAKEKAEAEKKAEEAEEKETPAVEEKAEAEETPEAAPQEEAKTEDKPDEEPEKESAPQSDKSDSEEDKETKEEKPAEEPKKEEAEDKSDEVKEEEKKD